VKLYTAAAQVLHSTDDVSVAAYPILLGSGGLRWGIAAPCVWGPGATMNVHKTASAQGDPCAGLRDCHDR
jgi:hypothetical protein